MLSSRNIRLKKCFFFFWVQKIKKIQIKKKTVEVNKSGKGGESRNPHRSQSSARSPVRSLQPFLGGWDLNSLQSELKQNFDDDEEEDEAEAIETST